MKNNKGFTLIELMIIVVVIGILGTIATLSVNKAAQDVKDVACYNRRLSIQAAEEMYVAEFKVHTTEYLGGFQINTLSDIASEYFPNDPGFCKCPDDSSYYYWSDMNDAGEAVVICSLHNPDGEVPNPTPSASASPTPTPTTMPTQMPTPTPNQAPIANDDGPYQVTEDSSTELAVVDNDTDKEGDPIYIAAQVDITTPSNGTAILNGDTITYTPTNGYYGTDSFTYRIYDEDLYSNYATVAIDVSNGNSAPVAVDDNSLYTVDYDKTLTVSTTNGVLSNDIDADGNPLSAYIVQPSTKGTVTLDTNGSFTFVPNVSYATTTTFTYRAYDGRDYSNDATVQITITVPETTQSYLASLSNEELLWFFKFYYGLGEYEVNEIIVDDSGTDEQDVIMVKNNSGAVRADKGNDYIYVSADADDPDDDSDYTLVYGGEDDDYLFLDGEKEDFKVYYFYQRGKLYYMFKNINTGQIIYINNVEHVVYVDSEGNRTIQNF